MINAQEAGARIVDTLLNIETVKYFDNEKFEHEQCDEILQEQEDAGVAKYQYDSCSKLAKILLWAPD